MQTQANERKSTVGGAMTLGGAATGAGELTGAGGENVLTIGGVKTAWRTPKVTQEIIHTDRQDEIER